MNTVLSTKRRRDSLTIMGDLLGNMNQPTKITHILYKTNLSHSQLKKHLEMLVGMGFVQEINKPIHSFVITERGRTFVQLIASNGKEDSVRRWQKIHENNVGNEEGLPLTDNILSVLTEGGE